MSTAITTSNDYAECDEFIEHRISVARNRIKWTDLLTALLLAGVLLIGYVMIFTLLDHWVIDGGFAPVTRAVMLGIVLSLCAAIVFRYVIQPWTKQIHPLYAARMLDSADGKIDGALMSAVDLGTSKSATSASVRRSIEKRAAIGLAAVNIDEAIDRKWLMNLGLSLFFLVLLTCIYAVFSPKSMNLLRPLSLSNAAVATQTRILRVQPGDTMIQAGEELEIVADINGQIPDAVHVLFTTKDQTYVDEQITMSTSDDAGRYRVTMVGDSDRGLRQDFTYRIVAGDATSEEFVVTVDEPPTANVSQLEYVYPDYMGLPKRLTENGNIDGWEGTDVFVTAETNVPVRLAILKFSDDPSFTVPAEEFSLSPNGNQLSGRLRLQLRSDGTTPKYYRIDVTDVDGRIDPQPTVYSIKIRPDKGPVVKLLDPIRDMRVPANAVVPLLVEAEDPDFLLRSVKLELTVNGEPRSDQLLFDATRAAPTRVWARRWELQLKPLALQNGDVVRYQVAARDNKPPLGTQQRTSTLQLFIEQPVSDEQVQQQLQEDKRLQDEQRNEQPGQNQQDGQSSQQNDAGDNRQARPDDQNAAPNETGEQGEPSQDGQPMRGSDQTDPNGSGMPPDDPDTPNAASESDTTDPTSEAGGESSEKGSDATNAEESNAEQSSSKEGGTKEHSDGTANDNSSSSPKTDEDALQEILDAYKDALDAEKNAGSPGDENVETGIDRPEGGEPNQTPDNGIDTPANNQNDPKDGSSDATMQDPDNGDSSMESNRDNAKSEDPVRDDGQQTDGTQPKGNSPDDPAGQNENGMPDNTNSADETGANDQPEQKNGEQKPDAGQQPGQDEMNRPKDESNAPKNSGDQPEPKNGAEGEKQSGESGKQGGESEKQGGESGKQGGESGKQGGESGKQGGESGKQGGESGKQGGESGKQGGESGKQGGESGKQGGESGKQGGESGKQGGESGKQGGESGKQGGESGKQGGESGKQGGESGKQGGESGKQGGESGKQGGESGKQGGESGKQGGESGKQGGESGKQGGESGKQGGESGKQGGESGKQGGESGKQGGESGKQGGESGKQGGESGKQGGESGKQGGESGKEGGKGGQQSGKQGGKGQPSSQSGAGGGPKTGGSASADRTNPEGGEIDPNATGQAEGGQNNMPDSKSGGEGGSSNFQADDPNVTDAAQAADLVLKRLKKDLDRGKVDSKLLEKLGWTEGQLQAFGERMQKQLDTFKEPSDDATRARQLQQRRVEEMLKSLNLKSKSKGQVGSSKRDTEQQDTTIRRTPAPAKYRDLMELYERSLSEGDQ